ncbi:hypothetical protein KP509_09G039600 [Ceratopteris richardii]|nr:hypothetical protein KP509_09G039600 [Ceratopteris richardii]KAH7429276.1 hypothetical protein KP509_09G039600 [Ceratopteris richardii]
MNHMGLHRRRPCELYEVDNDALEGRHRRRHYESYELDDSSSESSARRKRRVSESSSMDDSLEAGINIVASFCGNESNSARIFGVLFPCRSYPLDASNFIQIDHTHWVLDMSTLIGESYDEVKDICIFLLDEFSIPPEKALALYVQSPGSHYQYCGAVTRSCPSAVLALLWPTVGGQRQLTSSDASPLSAKIGLAVEDMVTLPTFNVGKQQQLEALALRIGENLVSFLQFFTNSGDKVLVPLDILNKWFKKFQEKLRRDSNYIKTLLT